MQKIVPFLWFDNNAEEAVKFYTSIFRNSKIINMTRMDDARTGAKNAVLVATFQLEGQEFMALNGGPMYEFTPAISLYVNCETQAEVDELWQRLSEGGKELQCGWLTDKFGITWQIIPTILGKLIGDNDPVKAKRAMDAMIRMVKIDIEGLKRAHEGR